MIQFQLRHFQQIEWDRLASQIGRLRLPQTWAYGEAKAKSGWTVERCLLVEDGRAIGLAQVMLRSMPFVGGGLAWINRGPIIRAELDGGRELPETVPRCLDTLRRHYVEGRSFYLRIAPPWSAEHTLKMSPGQFRFEVTDVLGWASAVIDLTQSDEALRSGLSGKWRNGLRKAERLGVQAERSDGEAFFREFIDEYTEFVSRRRYTSSLTPDLIRAIRQSAHQASTMMVYRALHAGMPLGSALTIRYDKCTEYMAGTLLEAGRNFNPGQLLLWRAICESKALGSTVFDVGGMDPVGTTKGIYDFKKGMGGTPYRLGNEIHSVGGGIRCHIASSIVRILQKR